MASAVYAEGSADGDDEMDNFLEDLDDSLHALSVNNPDVGNASVGKAGSSGNSSRDPETQAKPAIEIRKVYVGNLDKRLTSLALGEFFSAFGTVQNAHFARKGDGSKENYGFVTFYDPEDAEKALEAGRHGMRINRRTVIVNKAALRHQPKRRANGKMQWHWRPMSNRRVWNPSSDHRPFARHRPVENIDESLCVIHLLNDDCLMHVFSFLSKMELIKIEKVSKHWKECSMQMWRSTKHLNFDWLTPDSASPASKLTTHILGQITDRCGPNIQSIDVSHKPSELDKFALKVVAEKCPNLQCLNFSFFHFHNNLKCLHGITGHLQRVIFNSCNLNDRDLQEFLELCPELTSVSVADNSNLSGACLAGLSSDIEELTIDNCYGMRDQTIVDSFSRLKCLKRLSMNGCLYVKNSMLEDIFKSIPQLESISMNHRFPLLHNSGLAALSHLTGLVSLTLHLNAAVNDEVLRAISKNCKKIENLDISGCSVLGHGVDVTVTDKGIVYLAQMPKLTHLKMSYMAILSNQALESLAEKGRLKMLECRGCPTFTDFGCSRLISLSNELEHFDVSGCNYITLDTLHAANASVKLRTNGVTLTLIVGGTAVDEDCLPDEIDPLLHLDFSDLCVDRHRPDFVDEVYFMAGDDDENDTDDEFDFELDDDDDISDFDLECQAMFIGDDIGEWFKFQAQQGGYETSDSELDDEIFGPYFPK